MTPLEGHMAGASKPRTVDTKRQRIAQLARQSPEMGLTSLAHHIDIDWLTEAFDRTRKDGAVGPSLAVLTIPSCRAESLVQLHGEPAMRRSETNSRP